VIVIPTALDPGQVRLLSREDAQVLVERHRAPIFRVALRMLNDRAEAEDAAQEVMLRLCRTHDQLKPGSDVGAWAYALVVNLCRDQLRSSRHQVLKLTAPADLDAVDGKVGPELALDAARREAMVREVLQKLPPTYRAVLVLRDMEGQSYERMCAILDLPETTLKARVIRARRAMARALAQHQLILQSGGRR
jgi:RNA polymerase sigma-70 factor (ECF subfamily)